MVWGRSCSYLLQPNHTTESEGTPSFFSPPCPLRQSLPTVRPTVQPALRRCQGIFNNRLGNEKPNQKLVRGTPSPSLSLGGGCGEGTDAKKSVEAAEEFPGRKERGNCFYGPAPHQCQASALALHFSGKFQQKHCEMEANLTLPIDLVSEVGDLASDRSLL